MRYVSSFLVRTFADLLLQVPFDVGFPMNMLFEMFKDGVKYDINMDSGDVGLLMTSTHLDVPKRQQVRLRA